MLTEIENRLGDDVDRQPRLTEFLEGVEYERRHETERPCLFQHEYDGEWGLRLGEVTTDRVDDMQTHQEEERPLEFAGTDAPTIERDE